MEEQQPIEALYAKFIEGHCTSEELGTLYRYFHTSHEEQLRSLIAKELEQYETAVGTSAENDKLDQLKQLIDARIFNEPQKTRRMWPRIAAAASILAILSTGIYYFSHQTKPQQVAVNTEQIAPVQKGVYLTLGNGHKLRLDQRHQGRTKNSDGTVTNENRNELSYGQSQADNEPQIHTLTNNSSTKYSLILADGTEAYLDIASSITYPAAFKGKERKVSITGQAFFKVKHDAAHPFSVTAGEQIIEDIGTEFNINAYHEVTTTLLQGAVRVNVAKQAIELVPGEAAYLANDKLTHKPVDVEMAMLWLQGKIPLNHRTLGDVLAEVGRIYNVEFLWPDVSLKQLKFGGAVSRTQKLGNVLDFFRNTGKVDFMVNGKTIIVLKKKK